MFLPLFKLKFFCFSCDPIATESHRRNTPTHLASGLARLSEPKGEWAEWRYATTTFVAVETAKSSWTQPMLLLSVRSVSPSATCVEENDVHLSPVNRNPLSPFLVCRPGIVCMRKRSRTDVLSVGFSSTCSLVVDISIRVYCENYVCRVPCVNDCKSSLFLQW